MMMQAATQNLSHTSSTPSAPNTFPGQPPAKFNARGNELWRYTQTTPLESRRARTSGSSLSSPSRYVPVRDGRASGNSRHAASIHGPSAPIATCQTAAKRPAHNMRTRFLPLLDHEVRPQSLTLLTTRHSGEPHLRTPLYEARAP